jgi:hypothetical protein
MSGAGHAAENSTARTLVRLAGLERFVLTPGGRGQLFSTAVHQTRQPPKNDGSFVSLRCAYGCNFFGRAELWPQRHSPALFGRPLTICPQKQCQR